jgi:hypothetical protein
MEERTIAWILAHRLLLPYLMNALRGAVPEEPEPGAIDATATMLQQQRQADVVKSVLRCGGSD